MQLVRNAGEDASRIWLVARVISVFDHLHNADLMAQTLITFGCENEAAHSAHDAYFGHTWAFELTRGVRPLQITHASYGPDKTHS